MNRFLSPQNDKVKKVGYRLTKFKKNCQRSFPCFLLVEAEAISVEAEAADEIAASTFLLDSAE